MVVRDNASIPDILVTGCSGYIGSHLKNEMHFLGLDRDQEVQNLSDFNPKDPRFRSVRKIVHLADRRLQDICAENLKSNIATHKDFLKKLGDLPNIERVIFSSSCSVYGYSNEMITETSPVRPTSFYAESKLAVEDLLKTLGLPHRVLRFGTAYGWSPQMRSDLFINELALAAARSQEVEIYSPEAWRPYIHCRDFAKVLKRSLGEFPAGPINIVTQNMTKRDILDVAAIRQAHLRFRIVDKGDLRNYKVNIDPSMIKRPLLIDEGIHEMIGLYHDHKK